MLHYYSFHNYIIHVRIYTYNITNTTTTYYDYQEEETRSPHHTQTNCQKLSYPPSILLKAYSSFLKLMCLPTRRLHPPIPSPLLLLQWYINFQISLHFLCGAPAHVILKYNKSLLTLYYCSPINLPVISLFYGPSYQTLYLEVLLSSI